ncbi:MAG: ubiquinone/menaquinone biosynthesis C-methylase UbiE [Maribacter sp.]|jgi:ubiquinone/menaquinone biosynthesis C-methylase UbiE
MKDREYIHGYTEEEQNRLIDQGSVLAEFVFDRLDFSDIQNLLEVGCGVGAQTAILLKDYPNLHITGIEIEEKQLEKAKIFLSTLDHAQGRYDLLQGNAADPQLSLNKKHDTALFIWVLEHVNQPIQVLRNVQRFINQGGKVFAIEVFHSSLHLYPDCPSAMEYWQKSIEYQYSINGDADIGQRMGNLFHDAGFKDIKIAAYPMHFGKYERKKRSKMLKYWHELMKSAFANMKDAGYATDELWQKAEQEILALQNNDEAVFYYSFVTIEGRI